MAVEFSTASTTAPDPYLLLPDLLMVLVELEENQVSSGISLYLDLNGNSVVSCAHCSLVQGVPPIGTHF